MRRGGFGGVAARVRAGDPAARSMPLRFMPSYCVWLEVSNSTVALPRSANEPSAVPGRFVSCG